MGKYSDLPKRMREEARERTAQPMATRREVVLPEVTVHEPTEAEKKYHLFRFALLNSREMDSINISAIEYIAAAAGDEKLLKNYLKKRMAVKEAEEKAQEEQNARLRKDLF